MSLHNLNTPNKQWLMYLNTLSSISGDDLTIKPDNRRNLLLEVSGNNNIFIKKGDASYNLTNLITGDASFSNVDVSVNLNPLQTNSNIGLPSKVWRNAYIRDISVTNISISGNMTIYGSISNVIQTIPRLANDISSSLGTATYIWQRAFIRDLSSISTTNGTNWPVAGPTGLTGPLGPTGPPGAAGPVGPTGPQGLAGALGVSLNATLTDISNFRITNNRRIYQNICGDISGDISWSAVNGYYGLAKDAYPSLNQQSSGVLAVKTWTSRSAAAGNNWYSVCWSPELRLFVAIAEGGANKVMTSSNGINWIGRTAAGGGGSYWQCVCWSPQLRLFVALGLVNIPASDVRAMFSSDGVSWSPATSPPEPNFWRDVCWSPELGLFLAVANGGTGTNRLAISSDGKNWTGIVPSGISQAGWWRCCWSPQLSIFLVIGVNPLAVIISSNGTTWSPGSISNQNWSTVCWSPELGIFLAVTAGTPIRVTTSSNGITWTGPYNIRTTPNILITGCCWSSQLGLFVAVFHDKTYIMYSYNGINWTFIETGTTDGGTGRSICWSPELGIFVSVGEVGTQRVMTSSLKGRPPTSYNVFDSSFNRINENGIWDFSNINVTTLYVNNVYIGSDDRLKHNELAITNGLDVIERLTPKFYQKTQVLLDASYNGDLSGHAWTYEAGLIAQEVLQISDLSYVVGGGDYYEQKYNLITQTQTQNNDLSANYYEVSNNYYELSNNYYEPSANNYEVINNLITQAYNLNYNSVFVYGLAAIKELHAKVKAKEISILQRQTIINNLITRIETLESARQDVSNNIL
jgi:hypothetical protein